ncbi:MAG: hypothetical protein U5R48_17775 [Gammaproteobacteria bacterium]|nr:hypothetical protein [Gammaproteobacteria bacterium]
MTLVPGARSGDDPGARGTTRVFFALGPDPEALPGLGDLQRRLLPLCRGRRVRPGDPCQSARHPGVLR